MRLLEDLNYVNSLTETLHQIERYNAVLSIRKIKLKKYTTIELFKNKPINIIDKLEMDEIKKYNDLIKIFIYD